MKANARQFTKAKAKSESGFHHSLFGGVAHAQLKILHPFKDGSGFNGWMLVPRVDAAGSQFAGRAVDAFFERPIIRAMDFCSLAGFKPDHGE